MDNSGLILSADIGGTNARFGCLEYLPNETWNIHDFTKVRGADYPSFDKALESYLSKLKTRPSLASLSVAGPVVNRTVSLTNANWNISASLIEQKYGFKNCALYNDFAGMTRSVPELNEKDFRIIREGETLPDEPILVAGPGTGFGVGFLLPVRGGWHVMATEGGHSAYAAQTPLEIEFLQILLKTYDFVSVELVSSGSGLSIVHRTVSEIHNKPYVSMHPDKIRELAVSGDPICFDVCQIRAAATMGAIGDLVLSGGARGGVVLAGGVSERMVDFYTHPPAMARFLNRGVRSQYMEKIPIKLLASPMAPLIGAASLFMDAQ